MKNVENNEIIAEFLECYSSPSSRKMIKTSLQTFLNFNNKNLLDLTKHDIMAYRNMLNNNSEYRLQTKKNKLSILTSFVQWVNDRFSDEGILIPLPFYRNLQLDKREVKEKDHDFYVLNPKEIETFLNWLKYHNYKYFLIMGIFAFTGCRKSELINIKIKNVHLEDRWFKAFGKTNWKEYIMDKRLCNYLNVYLKARKEIRTKHDNLFLTNRLEPYGDRAFNLYLQKIIPEIFEKDLPIICKSFRKSLNQNRFLFCNTVGEERELLIGHKNSSVNMKHYLDITIEKKVEIYDSNNPYKDLIF